MRRITGSLPARLGAVVIAVTAATGLSMAAVQQERLSVLQIMQGIVAPMTSTIWGAYDIQTDAQWQELENAALTVVAAGILLEDAGSDAQESDWRAYNGQMIAAARAALEAISRQDEEALFNAGNDQLYPPCESCHQRYMAQ